MNGLSVVPTRESSDQPSLFPNTRWSLIEAMGDSDDRSKELALGELCRIYWKPIYLYLRRKGKDGPEAEDLTQAFFAALLKRRGLESVSLNQGRLRAYLLQAVRNFLVSDWKHRTAAKRGGGQPHFSFDSSSVEASFQRETLSHEESPERLFERQWALTLIERSLQRLREEYEAIGRVLLFELVSPLLEQRGKWKDSAALCARLDMSEGNLRVALHRMRKRFRSLVEDEIAQTVSEGVEVKDELRHLMTILARG